MSLEFEYRHLAAACLDLSKRAAVLADKMRLLLIAEAWFELADRISRKRSNAKRRHDGSAEHPVAKNTGKAAGPGAGRAQPDFGRIDSAIQ
jgi:hypothetical protein